MKYNDEVLDIDEFKLYKRYKENDNSLRCLISFSPYNRVLSTYLIFELVSAINWRFDSFSYNLTL